VSSKSEVRQCWKIVWQMMSVEMPRAAVGRTTIECSVRWCVTRCAGSDTAEMTSAESWTSARPACSWCAVQQAASAVSGAASWRLTVEALVDRPIYTMLSKRDITGCQSVFTLDGDTVKYFVPIPTIYSHPHPLTTILSPSWPGSQYSVIILSIVFTSFGFAYFFGIYFCMLFLLCRPL